MTPCIADAKNGGMRISKTEVSIINPRLSNDKDGFTSNNFG